MTSLDLKGMLDAGQQVCLLDVREPWEHNEFNLGGTFIPFGEVMRRAGEIAADRPVVVYCKKGVRSAIVIQRLEQKAGLTNLVNLEGGIEAWRKLTDV